MRPKAIPRTTLLGQRGVNLIERLVMEMGFVWYPTGSVEAGIDGHIELRDGNTGHVLNAFIGVQSKAVEGDFPNETTSSFDFYPAERDLDYWLKGNLPVLLVVSRPRTDEAYWVSVKDYFRDPARCSSRKVRFEKRTNCFDESCRTALFELAAPRDAGIYLAPPRKREFLISNLLPVAFLPERLYIADTEFRDAPTLLHEARGRNASIGGEWILRHRRIIGFHNFTRPEWEGLCDQGTVEEFSTEEWSQTEDPDRLREFVDLLRRTLREMVRYDLEYHRKLALYFFRATHNLEPRDFPYKGIARPTDRTVFAAYRADDGSVKYYRHSAFRDRFLRFEGEWYLEITPTYFFTSDGYRVRGRYEWFLRGIKQREGHEAVRGQVIMWAAFLTPHGDLLRTEPYPFLGFWNLMGFEVDCGIPDADWASRRADAKQEEEEVIVSPSDLQQAPLFAP